MTAERFPRDVIELFHAEREVDIETWSPAGDMHRTINWVVAVDGVPYIRSYRGTGARWYREIRAEPHGAIHAAGRRIALRAVAADDEASIAACSAGLASKYARNPALTSMLAEDVLGTTLRLEPG